MAIAIREDQTRAGGFAFIDLGRKLVRDPLKLSFRRLDTDPRHLGRDGWQSEIAWLEPDEVDQSGATTVVRVGPAIVDRIDELVPIEIFAQGEPSLGKVTWPQLTRSPGGFADLRIKAMTKPAGDPKKVHRSPLAGNESTSVPPGPAATPAVDPAGVQAVAEAASLERWQAIKGTADRVELHRFLAEFGATRTAKQARIRLAELATPIEPAPKRRRSPLPVLAGAAVLALLAIGVLAIAISNAGREFA